MAQARPSGSEKISEEVIRSLEHAAALATTEPAVQQLVIEAVVGAPLGNIERQVRLNGGQVQMSRGDRLQVSLPSGAVEAIASMEEVAWIRRPFRARFAQGNVRGEGIEITGADLWHQAGLKGAGVKLAVIDGGFLGYESLLGSELPGAENVVARSFRSDNDIECRSCPRSVQLHGLAVAEVAHDMSPDATLYLVNFDTELELQQAVDWLIGEGVRVINSSFGFITTGCPYEGTGFLDSTFKKAREAGIFWAASVGNDALMHWAGAFTDSDQNGLLNFDGEDESQTLTGVRQGEFIEVVLWWDDPCQSAASDYDLVIESSNGAVLDRSFRAGPTNDWPLEVLSYQISASGTYQIKIERTAGEKSNRISMLFLNQDHRPEYRVPEGSAGLTEPELSSSVVSVGATTLQNRLEVYSSQGPTPDGRIKPDIAAPDGVVVSRQTFGRFFGTSASSPHVAAAGALVKFAFPQFAPDEIQSYLESQAEDLGPAGRDPQFGAGLLNLGQAPFNLNAPNPPSELRAEIIGPAQINLYWRDNSDNEEGFIIERRLEQEADPEVILTDPDAESYEDHELEPETNYCYRVRAFTASATSQPSEEVCARTMAAQPGGAAQGQLFVVAFVKLEFLVADQWLVSFQWGCVVYRNGGSSAATLRITLIDQTIMTVDVPPGNEVIACGKVAHVDTRAGKRDQPAKTKSIDPPPGIPKDEIEE